MKKPCNHPGCPHLIEKGRYCQTHKSAANQSRRDYDNGRRKQNHALSESKRIRSSARWQKVQRLVLSSSPTCADPFGEHARRGTTETATQVHHIHGLTEHPDLAFTWSNLMAVCTRCHSRLEREVKTRRNNGETPPDPPQDEWCPFG